MKMYWYRALDRQGHIFQGYMLGHQRTEVISHLVQRQLDPLNVRRQWKFVFWCQRHLYADDLLRLFLYLEYSTKVGHSIVDTLKNILPSFSKRFRDILATLINEVSNGSLLSTACKVYPALFSPVVVALLQLGENSGRFSHVCHQIRQHLKTQHAHKQRIIKAITYPLISLGAFIGVMAFLSTHLLPDLIDLLISQEAVVPLSTQFLALVFSISFIPYLTGLLGLCVGLYGIYWAFYPRSAYWKDHLFFSYLPFGKLWAQFHYDKFFRSFCLLYQENMPLMSALATACQIVPSPYIRHHLETMQQHIQSGKSLSYALAKVPLLDKTYVQFLHIGETTSHLSETLDYTVQMTSHEHTYKLDKILGYLNPFLLLLGGICLLILVSGTILPLYHQIGGNPNG